MCTKNNSQKPPLYSSIKSSHLAVPTRYATFAPRLGPSVNMAIFKCCHDSLHRLFHVFYVVRKVRFLVNFLR